MDSQDPLYFNGLDPRTGAYLFAPQTAKDLAQSVAGTSSDEPDQDTRDHLSDLKHRIELARNDHFGVKVGVDASNLAEAGWAAIFPAVAKDSEAAARQQNIADALAPLFALRQQQAGARFKLYRGPDGHRPRESKARFLARHGAGPGPVDPDKVPYYLLIVAAPDEIPFAIQYQLDVQYAVGRIHFDSLDDYAAYARSVVAAESGGLELAREVASFAVANPDDPATQLSAANLVAPLVDQLESVAHDWKFTRYAAADASKANLARLLGGDATPAVLFTASHGAGFARGDELQRRHQGALICQDWPGPLRWARKPLPADFYFSADDLGAGANPHGVIVFNFACYGAGTPQFNDYGQRTSATQREAIADVAFQSALHQRLLSLPRGGALAAVGHVERAWGCSFVWPGSGGRSGGSPAQLAVFESAMRQLLAGYPIGAALEFFNQRYAELSSDLSAELEDISYGKSFDAVSLADMWTANNDARGYAITGDPAVRIPAAPPGGPSKRVEVERIALHTTTTTPEPVAPPAPAPTSAPPSSGYNFAVTGSAAPTTAELARVFGDGGVLTVRTFIADPTASDPTVEPLAVTRIGFDGSVDNTLPTASASPAALQLHADTVRHAQAHRAALLQALAAIAGRLPKP